MDYTIRKVSLYLPSFIQFVLTLVLSVSAFPAICAEKPYCRWGDCEDGLGEKIYPSSSGGKPWSYIANFRGGKRYKYAISMREGSNWICEVPYTTRGNRSGLQFCATESGSVEFAYVDPKGKVKGSPYLRLFKGKITEVGKWFATDNVWPVPINLDDLYRDQKALRKTGKRLDEFLPHWFPEYKSRKTFITEKEMLASIDKQNKAQKEPKVAKSKSNRVDKSNDEDKCLVGDCQNGIGERQYASFISKTVSTVASKFVDGKANGYGLFKKPGDPWVCEVLYTKGKPGGLRFCATKQGDLKYTYTNGTFIWRDTPYILIKSGGEHITGRFFNGDMIWIRPVDTVRVSEDHSALRSMAGPISEFLPEWFPSPSQLRQRLSAIQMRGANEPYKATTMSGEPSPHDESAGSMVGCIFGDCVDGFGSYVFANGDKLTGSWRKSNRHGHFIEVVKGSQLECELNFDQDERVGPIICFSHFFNDASIKYLVNSVPSGPGVNWTENPKSVVYARTYTNGVIFSHTSPYGFEPAGIDTQQMAEDWELLRNRATPVIRESVLSSKFLSLEVPDQSLISEFLREQTLASASKTQVIPKEAPIKLGCLSGNCENGFGELATRRTTYLGEFKNGKFTGYVLITSGQEQCEAQMKDGVHDGVEHCVSLETGNHTFSEKTGLKIDGIEVTYTRNGSLVDYAVYKRGVKQSFSFTSERDKERLASLELEFLLEELANLKRRQDSRVNKYKVAALNKLPVVGAKRVNSEPERKITTRKTGQPVKQVVKAPKTQDETRQGEVRAERGIPKKAVPNVGKVGSSQRPQTVEKTVPPDKPKSNLQKLAYVVAELNAGRRQINSDYRLDKVRIDPNKFELVYEFTATKPISELNTAVIKVANQTAYCSSRKLKPFRDENMPARWTYVDDFGGEFETVSSPSSCG